MTMHASRREFLGMSMAAGAAAAFARLPRVRADLRAIPREAPLRILILGGTAFVGPACMESALARGHKVTIFNRGRIEQKRKEAGRDSVIPPGVEVLYGNRDPNKTADDWKDESKDGPKAPNAPKGLSQLEGKKWDAVIDTSGFFPRMMKASTELLAPNVRQYIFISTLSVYKKNDKPGLDESDEVATLDDPNTEDFGPDFRNYGGGKAACEKAAEAAMPGRVANLRCGFIVGPRDTSGRFIYWPLRVERGGEVAVPGKPTDPIQLIDVRDLADWIMHLIETNTNGTFNATGPEKPLTMQAMLDGCKKATKADASFSWLDPKFIEEQKFPLQTFQLWIPPEGEDAGFHQRSVAKAVAAGLRFRPVEDTAKATLAWYHALPSDLQAKFAKPFDFQAEADLLKAWRERKG
jgi:2'-hydroxyisoflavone reductase